MSSVEVRWKLTWDSLLAVGEFLSSHHLKSVKPPVLCALNRSIVFAISASYVVTVPSVFPEEKNL